MSSPEETFVAVPLELLRLDEVIDFEIYVQHSAQTPHLLYRSASLPFTLETRDRLMGAGVPTVYVRRSDQRPLTHYIERNLGTILADPAVPVERKATALYSSLVGIVDDVFEDPRAGSVVPRSRDIVEHTCTFLYEQKNALQHLMRVCSFDYYTYTHSVNVFVFAMALGTRIMPRKTIANEFGMGALLHDVGKSRVSAEILNCKGRLTRDQFEEMKRHTVYGYEILKTRGGIHPITLHMVRHHHERIDGTGYPDGLRDSALSREVRALTIADVFDALTTKRSYKPALDTFEALDLMKKEMRDHIDTGIFDEFVRMMGSNGG